MPGIAVFLSYPKPALKRQAAFVDRVVDHLADRGFEARTLGVTDYDMQAPLTAIRRLMLECNGVITIAFRRIFVELGASRHGTDIAGLTPSSLDGTWLTTPWAHIEPAMAFQLGLPILIFREHGVLADGMLESGVVGQYMPEFNLDIDPDIYFHSGEWLGIMGRWEGFARSVVEHRGRPPQMY
jgi:hypothetical protein